MKDRTRSILSGDRSPPDGYGRPKHVACGRLCLVKRIDGDVKRVCPKHGALNPSETRLARE